jgi:nucleotide-binding universal stress UspA family protein
MLKILCPTDFSENSKFAIEYAIELSNAMKAQLYFATSFKVPKVAGSLRSLDEKIRTALEEDLDAFVTEFKHLIKTGINPSIAVLEGNTTDSLLLYGKYAEIDLIIMGTLGSSAIANMVTGSITKKMFEKSPIPVLAIPSEIRFNMTSNRFLLSLDANGIGNTASIELLKELKSIPDATIDVFHVTTKDEKVSLDPNSGNLVGIVNKIINVEGIDVVKEIKYFVDNNNIGILLMVGRKHSFWERLFVESNTTAELFSTKVPILILPE